MQRLHSSLLFFWLSFKSPSCTRSTSGLRWICDILTSHSSCPVSPTGQVWPCLSQALPLSGQTQNCRPTVFRGEPLTEAVTKLKSGAHSPAGHHPGRSALGLGWVGGENKWYHHHNFGSSPLLSQNCGISLTVKISKFKMQRLHGSLLFFWLSFESP